MALVLAVAAGVVGMLIGMVGVGGVLLPPLLVAVGGLTAHEATATSTWAFIFTGVVGTAAYSWRGVVPWPMLLRLAIGIVPAAFVGAAANVLLPATVVLLAMATLTLYVGARQLRPGTDPAEGEAGRELRTAELVGIGAVVGFGSALTGTGGPVLLVPLLLALGITPVKAVAVSQAAQLPVVISGSIGYLQAGLTDVALGTTLGVLAAVGTAVGAVVATRIHAAHLRALIALACIAAGLFLAARAAADLLGG
ncbi:hypothetical protein GCM10009844_12050 [Nocardioides koreensis]|uniref:Probable membrane transporter protein n=1 Tax=Nocardioides koreensis TaxID=433651 RepID=A0ABP5L4A4_9ACTN